MSAALDDARPARRHAASTRGLHLRRILRGRGAGYALALGVIGAFVAGAWLRSVAVMLIGPGAVVALVLLRPTAGPRRSSSAASPGRAGCAMSATPRCCR